MEEKYKIHAAYILAILITIIVVLITVRWSQIPNLAQLISFALTLSSLILSTLAIGYAVYSQSSLGQNLSNLNLASKDISDTAREVSNAAEELTQRIEAIPSKLESVEGKVEETNILLRHYSENRIERPPDQQEKAAVSGIVDLFIQRSSTAGMMLLYACVLGLAKKRPFDLREFVSTTDVTNLEYAQGFLIASNSAGLFDANVLRDIWNVISMDQGLQHGVRAELDGDSEKFKDRIAKSVRAAQKDHEGKPTEESHTAYILERVRRVESYFD